MLVRLFICIAVLASAHARPVEQDGALFAARDAWSASYTQDALKDRVDHLPGAPPGGPQLYGGYVTVDEAAGRALFYTFVESSGDPAADPLVLWLNGGPGCSSLGGGLLTELGPYYPIRGGRQLVRNKHAWSSAANVIFLESPAGVGFSYSNTSADARVGDERTAADSREFLLRWLDRFPQYRSHDFWLSGESYAGHYVPQLADAILRGNRDDPDEQPINLRGFLVGNALTDAVLDSRGALDFWWSHALVSTQARDGIRAHCNFSSIDPLAAQADEDGLEEDAALAEQEPSALQQGGHVGREEGDVYVSAAPSQPGGAGRGRSAPGSRAAACDRFIEQAMEEMGGINIYDIYADVCLPAAARAARQLGLMLRDHPGGMSTRPLIQSSGDPDPCIDNAAEAYLNRPEVQAALHANVSGQLPGPWADCTQAIQYSRADLLSSVLPLYRRLLDEEDIAILVYSGDVDAIVPVIGTRRWLQSLRLPVTSPWRAWRSRTGQVGGWTVGHGKLTFASVRGAGHMVPLTQAERSLHLFTRWVHQQPL